MAQLTQIYRFDIDQADALHSVLEARGFTFRPLQWAHWQARSTDAIVSLYRSGKLVIQARPGCDIADLSRAVVDLGATGALSPARQREPLSSTMAPEGQATEKDRGTEKTASAASRSSTGTPQATKKARTSPVGPFAGALARFPAPIPHAWIGIDETGKGDYFGPLVVCAARVSIDQLPLLAELGAADSKSLTDRNALKIADLLAEVVPHEIMSIGPERYNELYADIGNLNHLLAWAHAKAAGTLLESCDAELILSDAFSQRELVRERLSGRARGLRYQQRPRAEDDAAVACASILARARFLRDLDALGRKHGVALAKGAGAPVLAAGRQIVARHGAEMLAKVAKLHFRTTQKLTGAPR